MSHPVRRLALGLAASLTLVTPPLAFAQHIE